MAKIEIGKCVRCGVPLYRVTSKDVPAYLRGFTAKLDDFCGPNIKGEIACRRTASDKPPGCASYA